MDHLLRGDFTIVYEPRAEIHLGRLRNNYRLLAEHVGRKSIIAVVKANAYGHGLVEISRVLEEEGVTGLAVATLSEAVTLRKSGLNCMILQLSRPDPMRLELYWEFDVRPTIHGADDLQLLNRLADSLRSPLKFHLKIDSGMGRLGCPLEDLPAVLELVTTHPKLELEGLYSHFANADGADDSFLQLQLSRFNDAVGACHEKSLTPRFIHLANSAGALRTEDTHFNTIRIGLILWGCAPSEFVDPPAGIEPVMDLRAPLVQVRRMKHGSTIGYGCTYSVRHDMYVGLVQLGYADGLNRLLSNKGIVEIGHKPYPIVGRISMDSFAVGLGEDEIPVGTDVLIWGKSHIPEVSVEYKASQIDTIPYELLLSLGGRVDMRYIP